MEIVKVRHVLCSTSLVKDTINLILEYLIYKPENCSITINDKELLKLLRIEDHGETSIEELCIFKYKFKDCGYFYPKLYIHYKTYDLWKEPDIISILHKKNDMWIIEKSIEVSILEKNNEFNKIIKKYFINNI